MQGQEEFLFLHFTRTDLPERLTFPVTPASFLSNVESNFSHFTPAAHSSLLAADLAVSGHEADSLLTSNMVPMFPAFKSE